MAALSRWVFRAIVIILLFALEQHPLEAQHFLFRQFGHPEGLKNLAIRCLLQSREGFLWVGTEDGVYRFDGKEFTAFTTSQGLPSNWIETLSQSADGTIWIGTSAGTITFRNGVLEPLRQDPPIVYHSQSIAQAQDGAVYIASTGGLQAAKWSGAFWKIEPVAVAPQRLTLTVYTEGSAVWFTSQDALWKLDKGVLRRFSEGQGLPNDEEWSGIAKDNKGDLYVRSHNSLRVLHPGKDKFQLVPGLPSDNWSDELSLDAAGNLVIPTDEGLMRPDGALWAGPRNGLPDDPACCVVIDNEGQPWIGTATQGVYFWAGARGWEGYNEQDGLASHIVNAVQRDLTGTLWVGTRRSLHRMIGSQLSLVFKSGWASQIRAIRSTPDGTLWVATLDNGLAAVNPKTSRARLMDVNDGFTGQRIVGMDVIRRQLWVYTRQGVFVADFPKPVKHGRAKPWHFHRWTSLEAFAPKTRENSVYKVSFDGRGNLWAATLDGLFVRDNGVWHRFSWRDRLLEDAIALLTVDRQDRIWIGYSSDLGVSRLTYKDGRITVEQFNRRKALTSNVVNFLESDARGWVWVGTDSGVDVWQPKGWRHYDTEDGLIGSNSDFNAFFADRDGSVWIGTNRGLSHFDPSKEVPSKIEPAVALTDLQVNGKPIYGALAGSQSPGLVLAPGSTVKLLFSVPSFRERQHARFRYRLLGLDSSWIDEQDGDAIFPNLSYGDYRFEVKAYHPMRGWVTAPIELSFKVAPRWWQTYWAFGSAALLLGLLLVMAWRFRLGALTRQKNILAKAVMSRTAEILEEKALVESQRQRIEELFTESQRISKWKDQFLANISQEFRTPLHGVLGMTGLALATRLSREQREYLQAAERSVRSLLRLLTDILDFSKLQAGKLVLNETPFPLVSCVTKATQAFETLSRQKGLDFRVHLSDDLPRTVIGESGRLQQVLSKLISNAIKFTSEGRIHVLVYREPGYDLSDRIQFTVRDTGEGIPQEKWPTIFEPFTEADSSSSQRFGGTGLGLAICSRLIEQMGGTLLLNSKVGEGTTFTFSIPLPEFVEEPSTVIAAVTSSNAQSLRVLLVEDSEAVPKLSVQGLENEGYSVVCVSRGMDALELLGWTNFDFVLMDLRMPGLDGLEVTREIRRREKGGRRTPVIILATSSSISEQENVMQAGADAYLVKPVPAGELRRLLQESIVR
jgi:signal transduction histidine kinase/ActR/RegA family two-component response regulator